MATISSHILDSVTGTHAAGIRVRCYHLADKTRSLKFDVVANDEGRITENVHAIDFAEQYELVFHAKEYFDKRLLPTQGGQVMTEIVARLSVTNNDANYHIPVVLSPHSYTVWWSSAPS